MRAGFFLISSSPRPGTSSFGDFDTPSPRRPDWPLGAIGDQSSDGGVGVTRPLRVAQRTAWVRSETPIFLNRW